MIEVVVASNIEEYRYLCGYFQETVETAVREGWEFKIEVVYGNKSTTFDTDDYVCDYHYFDVYGEFKGGK